MIDVLWVEKYRPKKVSECVLPKGILKIFTEIVEKNEVPNLILTGPPGSGKTTIARAMASELKMDELVVNASENGNIDTLRTSIRSFVSTRSFGGNRKLVILDEADYLNPNSTQPALRGAIEEFSSNAAFVFTCNNESRIIPPLHSRTSLVRFIIPPDEKSDLTAKIFKRVTSILKKEGVTYDKPTVAELTQKYFPDFRRIINELQTYSLSGSITENILDQVKDVTLDKLIIAMRLGNFNDMRKWVALNADDCQGLFTKMFENLEEIFTQKTLPVAILHLSKYQFQSAFVQDQEINLAACLTELMADCEIEKAKK